MCQPEPSMPWTYAKAFYGDWSDYWLGQGDKIPPIYAHKSSLNHGITLAVPMGPPEVAPFVNAMASHSTWVVEAQGASLLDESLFVGHWAAISISLRRETQSPMRVPRVGDKKRGFFS